MEGAPNLESVMPILFVPFLSVSFSFPWSWCLTHGVAKSRGYRALQKYIVLVVISTIRSCVVTREKMQQRDGFELARVNVSLASGSF